MVNCMVLLLVAGLVASECTPVTTWNVFADDCPVFPAVSVWLALAVHVPSLSAAAVTAQVAPLRVGVYVATGSPVAVGPT